MTKKIELPEKLREKVYSALANSLAPLTGKAVNKRLLNKAKAIALEALQPFASDLPPCEILIFRHPVESNHICFLIVNKEGERL